jgi:hypothetical protein
MRSSRKPVAIVALLSFLAVPVGAWLVFGSHESPAAPPTPKAQPAFWSADKDREEEGAAMMTHGGWFCSNPDCRFLRMSGGQQFRSAKPQACSLCRQPLVPERPVAVTGPITGREGG